MPDAGISFGSELKLRNAYTKFLYNKMIIHYRVRIIKQHKLEIY